MSENKTLLTVSSRLSVAILATFLVVVALLSVLVVFFWMQSSERDSKLLIAGQENAALLADNHRLGQENSDLLMRLAEPQLRYFYDLNELEVWLHNQPPMQLHSSDSEWYVNALIMQQWATRDGYYLSVSYYVHRETITSMSSFGEQVVVLEELVVSCDVYTADGRVYSFDPETRVVEAGFEIG